MYIVSFQVEQLSETTGEQSVLLTASVSDGTLSRIGTDLGKHFIDGHDEIMADFLAFLKSKRLSQQAHHVRSTSMRRHDGASTLI